MRRVILKRIEAIDEIDAGLPIKPALLTLLKTGSTIITSLFLIVNSSELSLNYLN